MFAWAVKTSCLPALMKQRFTGSGNSGVDFLDGRGNILGGGIAAPAGQPPGEIAENNRREIGDLRGMVEQKSLGKIATEFTQCRELPCILNALGRYCKAQSVTKFDDGPENTAGTLVIVESVGKTAIDLQF